MSKAQHTPGPWSQPERFEHDALSYGNEHTTVPNGYLSIICDERLIVGETNCIDVHGSNQESNARLIAAAPETAAERDELKERVATLEQILSWCQGALYSRDENKSREALAAITRYSYDQAAIAKARGAA